MKAIFPGKCYHCGAPFQRGEEIVDTGARGPRGGKRMAHEVCRGARMNPSKAASRRAAGRAGSREQRYSVEISHQDARALHAQGVSARWKAPVHVFLGNPWEASLVVQAHSFAEAREAIEAVLARYGVVAQGPVQQVTLSPALDRYSRYAPGQLAAQYRHAQEWDVWDTPGEWVEAEAKLKRAMKRGKKSPARRR